jgi:hypothetical protein
MCWLNDGSHIDCLNQAKWRVQGSKDPSNRPIILQLHRVPHLISIINQRTEEDKWESWLGHFGRSPMRSVESTNRPPPQTTSNTFQPLFKVIRSHDVLGRWIQRSTDLSGGRPTSLRNSTTSHFVYNTPLYFLTLYTPMLAPLLSMEARRRLRILGGAVPVSL